jgi:hypothetical protein
VVDTRCICWKGSIARWFAQDLDFDASIRFNADGKEIVARARSSAALSEIIYGVLRLLAADVVYSVILDEATYLRGAILISAASLAYLMEQCHSLKHLTLRHLEMDEGHCRVLGTYSRPDLEIELKYCKLTSAGTSALAEVLGRNQGPTRIDCFDLETFLIADGLRRNSRLKSFCPYFSGDFEIANRQVLAISDALRENRGLVYMNIRSGQLTEIRWGAIYDSLKTHPTLEILNLHLAHCDGRIVPAVLTVRIQALLSMMEVNTSIRRIYLDGLPYLETNQFRSHVRVIQRTRPITYRAKMLGRALLAVRTDPNRLWMLLSGNAEVAFSSTNANLRTPAIAAAASNTAAVTAISPTLLGLLLLSVSLLFRLLLHLPRKPNS